MSGGNSVGGLVGYNDFAGSINNAYSSATVNGIGEVGGLVGSNAGTVGNTYSVGNLTGGSNFGVLVGSNTGSVSNSHVTKSAPSISTANPRR